MRLRFVALTSLAFCLASGTPAASWSEAEETSTARLERAAVEIEAIARALAPAAREEAMVLRRRLRGRIAGVGAATATPGARAEEAWRLLARLAVSREPYAAIESVLWLAESGEDRAGRELLAALPAMATAVARQAAERLRGRESLGANLEEELLRTLQQVGDLEVKLVLLDVVSRSESLPTARGIVAAAPPRTRRAHATSARERRAAAGTTRLRAALAAALAAAESPEVRRWRERAAFAEIARTASDPAVRDGRRILLLAAARLAPGEGARTAAETLAGDPEEEVALAAIDALRALGLRSSRARVAAVARAPDTPPAAAARAAAAVELCEPDRGPVILLELLARKSWRHRQSAARELSRFAPDDATFDALLRALPSEPNREVRAALWYSLRSFPRPAAIAAAIRALEPPSAPFPEHAARYLRWASGQRHGLDASAWRSWWRAAPEGFRFPPAERPAEPGSTHDSDRTRTRR